MLYGIPNMSKYIAITTSFCSVIKTKQIVHVSAHGVPGWITFQQHDYNIKDWRNEDIF